MSTLEEQQRLEDAEEARRQAAGRDHVKAVFLSFDKEGEEMMNTADLPTAVRLCGFAPTMAELEQVTSAADPEKNGQIGFEDFMRALAICFENYHSAEQLREAFRIFDPDNRGTLTTTDLRHILTHYGDPLTEVEINAFFDECKMEIDLEGNATYDELVQKLLPDFLKQV